METGIGMGLGIGIGIGTVVRIVRAEGAEKETSVQVPRFEIGEEERKERGHQVDGHDGRVQEEVQCTKAYRIHELDETKIPRAEQGGDAAEAEEERIEEKVKKRMRI